MKSPTKPLLREDYAEMRASQVIRYINKWVEQRYPKLSKLTKEKLIAKCLEEIAEEKKRNISLN